MPTRISEPAFPSEGAAGRLLALGLQARAERLTLVARSLAGEGRLGPHRSKLYGEGTEFAEYKPYAPGDDPRQLDWKVLARSDRLVVRRYETERTLRAEFIVDVSASMDFGTVELADDAGPDVPSTKAEAAVMAAAMLGLYLLRQGDSIAISACGEQLRRFPRRGSESQLPALCSDLSSCLEGEGGIADLATAVTAAATRLARPGWLVLITDALDEDLRWAELLAEASARGHDVMVLRPFDPAERDLPYDEPARFVEPESGQSVRANPSRVRSRYRQLYRSFEESLQQRLHRARIDHLPLVTGISLGEQFGPFLAHRGGGGR